MGIIKPRPALRKAGARRIKKNLADHADHMARLQANGMSRTDASTEAMRLVKAGIPTTPVQIALDVKDELKLYHSTICTQLESDAKNGVALTAENLRNILDCAWAEVEHDRNQRADKWAHRKGLI